MKKNKKEKTAKSSSTERKEKKMKKKKKERSPKKQRAPSTEVKRSKITATFPIYIRHFDGSQRAFDITLTDTVKDVKEMMEEGDMFDLIYAGAELDDKQTLEPNMELEMVVDRQKLAESRADEIFQYKGTNFWEYGGSTKNSLRGSVEMDFPPPTDININMMPFVFGDKNSIPSEYHGYLPLMNGTRKGNTLLVKKTLPLPPK
eukprot:TRINITY_DN1026_c0_g1_i14.p1 TRINITY_DN1026_c0_g1~~TRINITY_DN1026_c0_g1_i14.p1  ORF type:complete len:203 (+),score=43.14 TRINITY_DN1026_c0_g1_i14:383-991(+)